MKEGPSMLEIKICAGCKWFRVEYEYGEPQGKCYHPASEYVPQNIGNENSKLLKMIETPSWCQYERIEKNKKKIIDDFE